MRSSPRNPWRPSAIAATALLIALVPGPATALPSMEMEAVGPRTEQIAPADYAVILYVSTGSGNDASGDGSNNRPWATIGRALEAVADPTDGKRVAVLVAAGLYDDATIVCRPHVDLFGGFASGSWERDIFAHETVLDGRKARRVLIGSDHCRVDGFVIRNGRAFGPGGGMFCDNTSPVVSNNRFRDNHTVAPPETRPDRIHQQGNRGGALAAWYDAAPVVRNNVFSGNWTEFGDGGAVAVFGWSRLEGRPQALIESNVFVGNQSGTKDFDRTRSSSGGAIVCSHEVDATIRNNVIAHNRARGRSDAGGVYVEYYSSPEIVGNWIVGNEGDDDGGAIYAMRDGDPRVKGNLIAGNWTTGGGVGGIRVSKEGRMQIIENIIVRNQSGGGLALVDGNAVVEGNVIAENRGGSGLLYRQTFRHFQPTVIRNNQVFGNESGSILIEPGVGVAPVVEGNTGNPMGDGSGPSGLELPLHDWVYLEPAHQTEFSFTYDLQVDSLVGRAIRVGDQWSVVASASTGVVRVWGEFTPTAGTSETRVLEVLPDYSTSR